MSGREKLIIVGTGSATGEVVDFISMYGLYDIAGYAADEAYITQDTLNGQPVYPLEKLDRYIESGTKLFIAISWYQRLNSLKRKKYEELKARGFTFANLVSPTATVFSEMGEGNWIGDGCYLAYNTKVGNNNTFRPLACLCHGSEVGNHNVIGVRSNVAGHTKIGNQVYVGIGATVFNKLTVGDKCVIGGAAVVKRNLPDFSLVVAADSVVKQKDSESIEKYISIDHIKKTIGSARIEGAGKEAPEA